MNFLKSVQGDEGISFEALLALFHAINQHPQFARRNTFTNAQIFNLVTHYNDKREGRLPNEKFLEAWVESVTMTTNSQKTYREIISGAFVSQALQATGVLPPGNGHFYLPSDFSQAPAAGEAGGGVAGKDNFTQHAAFAQGARIGRATSHFVSCSLGPELRVPHPPALPAGRPVEEPG